MKQYLALGARVNHRQRATEPVDNRITIPLIDVTAGVGDIRDAEIRMTAPQLIEHITECSKALGQFCRRGDVKDALNRTAPGRCS